jgi:hypothetical protein
MEIQKANFIFDFYSTSDYAPEEQKRFEILAQTLEKSKQFWSPAHSDHDDVKIFSVPVEKMSDHQFGVTGVCAGVETGVVFGTPGELCKWNWDYCSKQRAEWNSKVDVVRGERAKRASLG